MRLYARARAHALSIFLPPLLNCSQLLTTNHCSCSSCAFSGRFCSSCRCSRVGSYRSYFSCYAASNI